MIPEAEALTTLLQAVSATEQSETLPLTGCLNRRSATRLAATVPLPGFDNSMMDGYAVRAAETAGPLPLRGTATQPAGLDLQCKLAGPGEAIRIFTGAPIPEGADAVIMQEDVGNEGDSILCQSPVAPGENIRRRGSDLCAGQILLQPGDRISPGMIGLLASQGVASLPVYRLPRIAILSTGDESAAPGSGPLQPGQIYNSNGPMLAALVANLGFGVAEAFHCPDSMPDTRTALARLAEDYDVLVISGGVSVGERDFIKPALNELGMPPRLWKIRIKPGKPFLFAQRERPQPLLIFGLPGNPVSAFVTFHLFVRPALLKWCGAPEHDLRPQTQWVTVMQDMINEGDRPHYIRGRVAEGGFKPVGLQRSDALNALAQTNALLRLDAGQRIAAGEWTQVLTNLTIN